MDTNPYRAPKAEVEQIDNTPAIPDKTRKDIRNAWVAAVLSGSITLIVSLIGIASGSSLMGFNAWTLLDAALIFGLAFGIYRKSRTCAAIMLVYFIGSKILMLVNGYGTNAGGVVFALAFTYAFVRGAIATFSYHKLMKASTYLVQD